MRALFLLGLMSMSCNDAPTNNAVVATVEIQEKKIFHHGLVSADNQFDGARLNDFVKLNDSTYQAIILPENTPVNNSPWFCFRIWSKEATRISLELV